MAGIMKEKKLTDYQLMICKLSNAIIKKLLAKKKPGG
jgi:hypothetical protein